MACAGRWIYLFLTGSMITLLPFCLGLELHTLSYQRCMAIVAFGTALLAGIALFRQNKTTLSITWGDIFVALYVVYGGCQLLFHRADLPSILFSSWTIVVAFYVIARNLPVHSMAPFLGGTCLVQVGIALGQLAGFLPSTHILFKITGSFWNPSQLGGYIACFFPLLAVEVRDCGRPARFVWLLLPLLAVLVLSDSRTAWIACAVGTLYAFRIVPRTKKQIGVVALCAALILFVLYAYKPLSALGRLHLWKIAVGMATENPLFGTGIHSFSRLYMLRQAHYFENNPDDSFADMATVVTTPYNEILHILIEQGIVGITLFAFLCRCFFLRRKNSNDRKYSAVLLAFLVFACFSYPGENMALLAGLALCLGACRGNVAFSIPLRRGFRLIPLVVILVVVAVNASIGRYYRSLSDGLRSSAAAIPLAAYRNEPEALQVLLQESERFSSDERQQALQWLAFHCPSPTSFCDIGYFFEQQGSLAQAENCYRLAACMVPNQVRGNYYLFKLYESNGEEAKACDVALRLACQRVKIENSFTIGAQGEAKRFLKKFNIPINKKMTQSSTNE